MKKLTALILAVCMCIGAATAISAANPFEKRLELVRLIRNMIKKDDNPYGIGELDDGVLTVYVATNGKSDADGTEKKPFANVEVARDALREIDKSKLNGITVFVKAGEYKLDETLVFTKEDSGSEDCPITYIAEDGAYLCGGISFGADTFEKAAGDTLSRFPDEVQDKLVMLDLKDYGYTTEQMNRLLTNGSYIDVAPMITVNGAEFTLARYPNASDGYVEIVSGDLLDKDGNVTLNDGNGSGASKPDAPVSCQIFYGDEHMERVLSWGDTSEIFVFGRYKFLWCSDNTRVGSFDTDEAKMYCGFSGGYPPCEGGILYWYNIPAELDAPGEYYVDRDMVLYYYPEENFETSRFTMATLDDNLVEINADWFTFDNFNVETGREDAIVVNANHVTIQNCLVQNVLGSGIIARGDNNYIYSNEVCFVGDSGISGSCGDSSTLTRGNTVVCNNLVHHWAQHHVMAGSIGMGGCGATVCHNEAHTSNSRSMGASGNYSVTEYNYIHDCGYLFADGGAMGPGGGNGYGCVYRYNLIENVGTTEFPKLLHIGIHGFTVDCDSSGYEFYGNIVNGVTGSGFGVSGGRDNNMHNNLLIGCGGWALSLDGREWAPYNNAGVDATMGIDDCYSNEIWLEAFPALQGVHGNFDADNPLDPLFEGAPAGNRFVDNYVIYDRANRHVTHNLESAVEFNNDDPIINATCEIEIPTQENGRMTQYNSRRDDPIVYTEVLKDAEAAGCPIMTEEQLAEIGRIGVGISK